MKKKICILVMVIFLLVTLLFVLLFWNNQNRASRYVYEDEECSISVLVPREWKCRIVERFVGDENTEGLPDSGLEIFVDEDELVDIYIFRQLGKVSVPSENVLSDSAFETRTGLKGTYYNMNDHERVCDFIILENEFFGVSITMAHELFEKNEKEINDLLNSIEIEYQK